MTANDYKIIQHFLSHSCGIVLSETKQYLVKNRLTKLLAKFELDSFTELASILQTNSSIALSIKAAVVDAMTTNETFWFRDDSQFITLKNTVLSEIFARKSGSIKIWSAACSSGQEPYTISMCVEDVIKQTKNKRNVQIIGTDISETILREAKSAVYSDLALSRGLDIQTRNRFFTKMHEGYQVNTDIKNRVRFQPFNLLKSFSVLGRFDIIFCRNVLIYFSDELKRDILSRMAASLDTGGYLFLSSTESMPANIKEFETVRQGRVCYFKKIG